MSNSRIVYRRKHVYKTRSNNVRRFRTPGGRLLVQYRNKRVSPAICGDTKLPLNGIRRIHPSQFRNLSRRSRTVSRPYGGSLSHAAVSFRIKRAFFNEELKLVKANAVSTKKQKKQTTRRNK